MLHKHGDLLYDGVIGVITEHLEETAAEVGSASDDQLLVVLNHKWTDHQIIMTMVRDILMYMVRDPPNQLHHHERSR